MTVSYQYEVASSTSGGFIRLLFRWRGSVWKVVYREMLFFTVVYISLTVLYRFAFNEIQKRIFERIVFFCSAFMDLIPLSFVLGFYVTFTVTRWWSQYTAIPWPDKLMNIIALYVPGVDETSRVLRRTMMRYMNLTLVLVLRSISMAVKRRFPTKDHLVDAGFMTKLEQEMLQSVPSTEFNTFWIPCTWFINLLREARQECRITDSNGVKLIMEEFNEFRSKCGHLWSYDWISVPLVYTQVVTLATYAFFVACIFGRQYVESPDHPTGGHKFEYYVPVFTIFQLFFYMGLLKVAEQLINPFGDDDEDFELNWIIDRHFKVSYLGVDTLSGAPPPLVRDSYFYEQDMKLPYTEASVSYKKKTYRGSVARMQVPLEHQVLLVPDFIEEDDEEDILAGRYPLKSRQASTWTIVGGEIGAIQPLNRGSMDSTADPNWKASDHSLYIGPSDGKNASGTWGPAYMELLEEGLVHPEGETKEPSTVSEMTPTKLKHKESVATIQDLVRSSVPKKNIMKKIGKKVVTTPAKHPVHLRRGQHPTTHKWVAFDVDAKRAKGDEVLSLYRAAEPTQEHEEALQSQLEDQTDHDCKHLPLQESVPPRTDIPEQRQGPAESEQPLDLGSSAHEQDADATQDQSPLSGQDAAECQVDQPQMFYIEDDSSAPLAADEEDQGFSFEEDANYIDDSYDPGWAQDHYNEPIRYFEESEDGPRRQMARSASEQIIQMQRDENRLASRESLRSGDGSYSQFALSRASPSLEVTLKDPPEKPPEK